MRTVFRTAFDAARRILRPQGPCCRIGRARWYDLHRQAPAAGKGRGGARGCERAAKDTQSYDFHRSATPTHKDHRVSNWTILCDFDGTVSVEDITDSLLERFARPGWQKIEQAWRRGEIGSHDCMAEQVALLDASREEIDAHLDSMMIDRAFPAFVAEAEAAGIPLAIVSDGLDYAIRRILDSHGLGRLPIIANRLETTGRSQLAARFPARQPGLPHRQRQLQVRVRGQRARRAAARAADRRRRVGFLRRRPRRISSSPSTG